MTATSSEVESELRQADMKSNIASVGAIGRIPVRNIWLLMLYASELYRELPPAAHVGVEEDPDELPNLVAELLTHAVERRMRRNLSFGYRRRHADLDRVRGRINLLRTERRQLVQRGRVACSFEELTVDTPFNQFVKAALNLLRGVVKSENLVRRCRSAAASMERAGVTSVLASNLRRRPRVPISQLGWLEAGDRRMLAAARLAFDLALPTEDAGASYMSTPDRDEVWARKLFERAVAGFYDVVLTPRGWRVVHGQRLDWPKEDKSPDIDDVFPSMKTDIVLERPSTDGSYPGGHKAVIDTKFTSILKDGHHRDRTLTSAYIYQIYAYLRSQERKDDPRSLDSTGVLLHPSVGPAFDKHATIQGHKIRFVTVDLAADSKTIRSELLHIAEAVPSVDGA